MAYEKQTWAAGQTITAEKMNHMEDGILNNQGAKGDTGPAGADRHRGHGRRRSDRDVLDQTGRFGGHFRAVGHAGVPDPGTLVLQTL